MDDDEIHRLLREIEEREGLPRPEDDLQGDELPSWRKDDDDSY